MPFGLTSASAVFVDWMNHVCKPHLEKLMIAFTDDIVIYMQGRKKKFTRNTFVYYLSC
jgi:hypothetical protein